MPISAISASSDYQNSWSQSSNSVGQQCQQDFKDLGLALKSGSLSGAQQAFSALQQLMPNAPSSSSQNQTVSSATGTDSINTDVNALSQAIQSGNQADAQSDLAKLVQDIKSAKGKGHHHHQHPSIDPQSTAAKDAGSTSASSNVGTQNTAATADSGISSGIGQYLAMLAMYQSSDVSGLNVSA